MRRIATALALALALALAAAPAAAQTPTAFYGLQNNASTTLASAYTPGSGQLVLQPGSGAMFGSPTTSSPIRVTCVQQATKSLAIFKATGRSGDTLTGVQVFAVPSIDATADIPFAAGDAVQMRVTAGTLADIHSAVNAAEGKLVLSAKGDVAVFGTSYARLPVGSDGQVLTADSAQALGVRWASASGTGTVTSVAATVPSILTVSGSPVTSSGTLAFGLASQSGNSVLASPADGSAGAPSFRSLVAADVPSLDGAKIGTGTVAAARLPLMGASGASHAAGIVPDPGATAGTTRYLREDGTWQLPAGGGSGTPGGSSGQVQYNSSGAFAGASGASVGADGNLVLPAVATPSSPVDGEVWHGTAQRTHAVFVKPPSATVGITQHTVGCLFTQTADATAANTTAETTLAAAGVGSLTLPENLLVPGKTIRVRLSGYYSSLATSPGTVTFKFYAGATLVATSPGISLPAGSTSREFRSEFEFTCRSSGASGSVIGQGEVRIANSSSFTLFSPIPMSAAATVDTTAQVSIAPKVAFSVADPANTITCTNLTAEAVN